MKQYSLSPADTLVSALSLERRSSFAHLVSVLLATRGHRDGAKPLAVLAPASLLLAAGLFISRPLLANGAASPVRPATEAAHPDGSEAARMLEGKKIVLDPGHGGIDHGAANGELHESEINLAIARRAADLLRKEGATVTLTRDGDTFVELNRRADFSEGQDLYLSVHVDSRAARRPSESRRFPIEVYFHGTEDAPAPAMAARLAKVLADSVLEPAGVAASDGKAYPARFWILRNVACPAYSIHFGTLNDSSDLAKLREPMFLDKLAESVVDGANAILNQATTRPLFRRVSSETV